MQLLLQCLPGLFGGQLKYQAQRPCSSRSRSTAHVAQDLADHSVQVLALAKFSALFCGATAASTLLQAPPVRFTGRTTALATALGVLDVLGYALFTLVCPLSCCHFQLSCEDCSGCAAASCPVDAC